MKDELLKSLQAVMLRDLSKLAEELMLYPSEESLWKIDKAIKNPGGNLCLHLCGNLRFFIGSVLGKDKYVRNRDLEFSEKNIPRESLIINITLTKKAVEETLPTLTEETLQSDYPVQVFGHPMKTLYFLIHLTSHLSYHVGQVNYHRRLLG